MKFPNLTSGSEHEHQRALFAWVAVARRYGFVTAHRWAEQGNAVLKAAKPLPEPMKALSWFHAIPNGGSRGDDKKSRAIRGGQLKAEGVRAGVADTFLPWPAGSWHGLYIEMKKPSLRPKKKTSKGGLSDEQIKFKEYILSIDYGFIVCYDWLQAALTIESYVKQGE